jgi:hypothetical protein
MIAAITRVSVATKGDFSTKSATPHSLAYASAHGLERIIHPKFTPAEKLGVNDFG